MLYCIAWGVWLVHDGELVQLLSSGLVSNLRRFDMLVGKCTKSSSLDHYRRRNMDYPMKRRPLGTLGLRLSASCRRFRWRG
jgi:hypothetical protein